MVFMCMLFLMMAAEVTPGPEPILVFISLHEIRGMDLRTGKVFPINSSVGITTALSVDPQEPRLYWTELDDKSSAYSSKLDGSEFSVVLNKRLGAPHGIAADYVGRILYITDAKQKLIFACKMDGSMCTFLHNTTNGKPRAIAVDPPEGLMYWSDWGRRTAGIYRSGMDGSGRITLVSEGINWPNGIALDHSTRRLYWCDAKLHTIEYISLDGETRERLIRGVQHPFAIDVFEDKLYWPDWSEFVLESANKFTGGNRKIVFRDYGKKINGVHVYHHDLVRQASNPCLGSSCSHICLLAPLNSYSCACPPGFNLDGNGRTCVVDSSYPMLLVNDDSKIYYIQPTNMPYMTVSELPLGNFDSIGGLAYDWKSKTLFVSDLKIPAIYAFNMTTLSRRDLVRHDLVSPESLAFDPRSGNLYWVDSQKGTVEVVSAAGSNHFVIVANLSTPTDIVLAPKLGKMFVSTIGESPSIWMYDMDGKDAKVLSVDVGFPTALAVHPSNNFLYWADSRAGTILSLDYDNTQSRPKIVREGVGNITSIAANDTVLYWTDSMRNVLHLVTHSDKTKYQNVSLPGTKSGMLSRKVIYASEPELGSFGFDCVNNNGECDFLCLTSPVGYTCVCPPRIQLSEDGRSCSEATRNCQNGHFNCSNGRCILSSSKCDGIDDCGDNSDETGCRSNVNSGCAGKNCSHICLPTETGFVCKCDNRSLTDTTGCEHFCPYYCPENTVCDVDGDSFVCKCPSNLTGEMCEKSLQHNAHSSNELHPVWIVCGVLLLVCLILLAISVLIYRKYRKSSKMMLGSTVQYVNSNLLPETCESAGKTGKRDNEYEAMVSL